MIVAEAHPGGSMMSVTRTVRHRMRDADIMADRDIQIAEWYARGWSQDRIGRMLRISQPMVCKRLATMPGPIMHAVRTGVKRYTEAIPGDIRDRMRLALLEARRAD